MAVRRVRRKPSGRRSNHIMKVKVIKKAELASLADKQETVSKVPKRRRIKRAVERWVAEIREKSDEESHVSFDALFQTNPESST
jgi:hypothetical protein